MTGNQRGLALVVGVGTAACVLLLAYFALTRGEARSTRYGTFAAAERDGAVARGWIPNYLPRSARQLDEWHDLDTNARRLRFLAPPHDLQMMATRLAAVSALAVGRSKPESRTSVRYFVDQRAGSPTLCFELDFSAGRAEMWSCSPDHALE